MSECENASGIGVTVSAQEGADRVAGGLFPIVLIVAVVKGDEVSAVVTEERERARQFGQLLQVNQHHVDRIAKTVNHRTPAGVHEIAGVDCRVHAGTVLR